MEEKYVTGYCRQMDSSRMVEVIVEHGQVTEADCSYGNCTFQGNCAVAKAIDELNQK